MLDGRALFAAKHLARERIESETALSKVAANCGVRVDVVVRNDRELDAITR